MRELEFRGKRLDTGEWVYGLLGYVNGQDTIHSCEREYEYYRVDSCTIGQHTGLKDKNGVRIFEGDVLLFMHHPGKVFYHDGSFRIIRNNDAGIALILSQAFCDSNFAEVIGNIHDNSELPEGKK
jgi:hypothetical protein